MEGTGSFRIARRTDGVVAGARHGKGGGEKSATHAMGSVEAARPGAGTWVVTMRLNNGVNRLVSAGSVAPSASISNGFTAFLFSFAGVGITSTTSKDSGH